MQSKYSNLYRTGFRTCFLAKKQCAPPKAVLQIRLGKWGEISGTRFARSTFWLPKNRLVRLWCAERDSNPRSPKAARLQRAVFDHSTIGALLQINTKFIFLHPCCRQAGFISKNLDRMITSDANRAFDFTLFFFD